MTSLPQRTRPRTSLGTLFSDTEVASLRAWLATGTPGTALCTAGPGSGLTTLVQLLVREAGLETVWIACGVPRVKALLEQAGASPLSVTMRRKLIVVDEFDALAATDSAAASDVLAFVRSKPPLPVLVLTHATRSQKALEYAKAWTRFSFGKPSDKALAAYLARVVQHHDLQVDASELQALASSVHGDVRAALMALELAARGGSVDTANAKDECVEGLDLTEDLLRGDRGSTVRECLRLFSMDSTVVPMGLYENYLTALDRDDLAAAALAADAFADADVVDRYLYSRQAWDLFEVYGVCSVAVPVLSLRRHRRSRPNKALSVTKFGSVWSKVYNGCAKTKHVKGICMAYADAGATPLRATELGWVRSMVRSAVASGDDEALRRACWPLRAADVLCLARLHVGQDAWYKQSVHARVKRLLAAAEKTSS